MKTIEIQLYKFDELTEEAKQKAINEYRENIEHDFIWSDAECTIKEFCKQFNIKTSNNSWLEPYFGNIEDCILELTGLRLQKYLINNFGDILWRKKYLKSGEVTAEKPKYHRMRKVIEIKRGLNEGKFYNQYYSNTQKESKNCNLTGMCYDEDILKPIYNFLEDRNPEANGTDFESLIKDCFDSLKKSIDNEIEYRESDEAIIEDLNDNDYDFTENGKIY